MIFYKPIQAVNVDGMGINLIRAMSIPWSILRLVLGLVLCLSCLVLSCVMAHGVNPTYKKSEAESGFLVGRFKVM